MPRGTKFKPEEIIAKLREAEVELARGKKIPETCKQIGVTEQTYYRWKKEYGGLRMDQAKRLKELEKENARLKRLLADAELDKAILKEAASGNFFYGSSPSVNPWLRSLLISTKPPRPILLSERSLGTRVAPVGISRRRLPHLSTSPRAQSFPEHAFVTG